MNQPSRAETAEVFHRVVTSFAKGNAQSAPFLNPAYPRGPFYNVVFVDPPQPSKHPRLALPNFFVCGGSTAGQVPMEGGPWRNRGKPSADAVRSGQPANFSRCSEISIRAVTRRPFPHPKASALQRKRSSIPCSPAPSLGFTLEDPHSLKEKMRASLPALSPSIASLRWTIRWFTIPSQVCLLAVSHPWRRWPWRAVAFRQAPGNSCFLRRQSQQSFQAAHHASGNSLRPASNGSPFPSPSTPWISQKSKISLKFASLPAQPGERVPSAVMRLQSAQDASARAFQAT